MELPTGLSTDSLDSDVLLTNCIDDVKDLLIINPTVKIYGRESIQHRSIGFFSNDSIGYRYSGQLAKSQPLTQNLTEILQMINTKFGTHFNGILVNKYENGLDYIGAHSDVGVDDVVSVSFGAVRTFRIRNKTTKKMVVDIPTISGGIIYMSDDFQKAHTHEIPKQTKVKEVRFSLTFRYHSS